MSKQTLILIAFLTLLTGIFIYLAVSQNSMPSGSKKAEITPTKKVPHAFTTLQLTSTKPNTVDVRINTNGEKNKITAVQLELSYDPKKLGGILITPGTFMGTTAPLINTIDQKTGRITYALAIPPSGRGKTGEGVVATITYRPLFTSGTADIIVLPDTLVTAEGISETVLQKATGVILSSSTPSISSPRSVSPSVAQ